MNKLQLDCVLEALELINYYIEEDELNLSTLVDELNENKYNIDPFHFPDVKKVKTILDNIKESLKDKEPTIKPDKPQTRSWFNPNMSTSLPTPYSWNPNIKQDSPVEICRNNNYDDDISSAPYSGPMPLDGGLKD